MSFIAPYRAPSWLPGGNLQTLYAVLIGRTREIWVRERWETPDGDFIDIDRMPRADAEIERAPLVVLFHGLEGGSSSHYACALSRQLKRRNWRFAVAHFRGCSGEPNRLPRAYHSGDMAEIDWILRRFRAETGAAPLFAVGVSLGGNALLKWLGEYREASYMLSAAASVSAPVDLMAAGNALGQGFNRVYTRIFLATMKEKGEQKLERYPGLFDARALRQTRTLREFDDLVTAPLHGFRGVDDYWTRASSKASLSRIVVPTLLLNARNDPFLPESALPRPGEVSAAVRCEFPGQGGHVGFVGGSFPGNVDWMPERVIDFFEERISGREGKRGG